MKIKTREQIPEEQVVERHGLRKELVIGDYDGSDEIVLRVIRIDPGRFMPAHTHDFPHIWKIEKGIGMLSDNDGVEHQVSAGQFIFIPNNERHGMRNVGEETLEYLCFGTAESEAAAPKR
jgi:quercetin dioxygenase-like cupin family protein